MNNSFSKWRDGSKPSPKKQIQPNSFVISDSEDDIDPSNDQNEFVIESSDYDDPESLQNSRFSARVEDGNDRRSTNHLTEDSDNQDDSINKNVETFNRLDDSSTSEDTPIVQRKNIKKKMIFSDSDEDLTSQSEEENEKNLTTSEASDRDDSFESTDHNHIEKVACSPDANDSNSNSNFNDSNAIRTTEKEIRTESNSSPNMSFEDSVDETVNRSSNHDQQDSVATINLDDSSDDDCYENINHGYCKNKFGSHNIDEKLNPKANVTSVIQNQPNFIDGNQLEVSSKYSFNISDSSYTEVTTKNTNVNNSNSEDDDAVVMSMVQKEASVTNIDPLIAQKRAILTCNIERVRSQLTKSKMLLNTANINMLPDKGEKLRHSIDSHAAKLQELSEELKSLPSLSSSESTETMPMNNRVTPFWKQLSEPQAIKPLGKKALETHEKEQALTVERLKDLHGSLNARPSNDELAPDPQGLKINLMPHQQHALAWLLWREKQRPHGGILADDMGLGKTLTMISLIMASIANKDLDDDDDDDDEDNDEESVHRKRTIRPKGGTLVVCPASLLSQWEGEINKRVKRGMLSVELYHGANRETVPRRLARNDVVITTYNLISRDCKLEFTSVLYQINWKRIILDEAHIVRNHKSQASVAVCNLHARYRWALTGTPIQNKELDLYALLKFLKCSPFDDFRVWKRWVDNKNAAGQQRLATVMKTLMLRRTKQELQLKGGLAALPDKNYDEIHIKLDSEEQLVYEKILVFSRTLFAQFLHQRAEKLHTVELNAGKFDAPTFLQMPKETQFTKIQNQLLARHADIKAHEILVLLLRLRQVCCHPALIHAMLDQDDLQGNYIEDETVANTDVTSGLGNLKLSDDENVDPNEIGVDRRVVENLLTTSNPVFNPLRQSSKMRAVLATIKEILDKGDKMVVVSQWTSMLEVVESHLKTMKGATYDILSGKVAVKNRQQVVESFNKVGSAPQILLLSLTAGGVGLNLVGGNHLLLLDIHWNPQLEAQAQDRIYRVGQTKSVYIYKFMCLDTVEQRIRALQEKKLGIAQGILTGAGASAASKLSLDDLKSLFSL